MKRVSILLFCIIIVFAFPLPSAGREAVFKTSFNSGDIPSIDQSLVSDFIGIQLADEMTVGLFRQDEITGAIEPGMATDWELSEDRLLIRMNLLKDVPWVRYDAESGAVEEVKNCDGGVRTVTAHDFVYGIERTLRPDTASPYAFLVNQVVSGAAAYHSGETTDFTTVGVKAVDDSTLEIRFTESGEFNLSILSMWMMHAMPSWIIDGDTCTEGLGERWTEAETYQGYGPFTLKEWVHDSNLTLIRNPFWPGTASVPAPKLNEVRYALIGDVMALSEYESGNMDYAVIPAGDYDRITTDPLYADHLVFQPTSIGTEWLAYNSLLAPTDDVRVRLALSYAVDKDAIVQAVRAGVSAPYFVNPGVSGAPKLEDYPNLGIMYDPEKAKALLAEYCEEKGITPAEIEIVYAYSTSDQNKLRAEAVQSMWEKTLGIRVSLQNSEWAVFKVERKEGLANVYRSSWVQDYMDANNFTADVFLCPGGGYQEVLDWPSLGCADLSNPNYIRYADTIRTAGKESDPEKRAELYAAAEEILLIDEAILNPLSWNYAYVLMNPAITAPESATGYQRWEKWEKAGE